MRFEWAQKAQLGFYVAFRIAFGLLFALHGAQKLFGWFGGINGAGAPAALVSLIGLAGVIELVGGLLVVLGLFTRLAALLNGVTMLVAYFYAHAANGLLPIVNGGEMALLYLFGFLVILGYGSGMVWSLDRQWFKKDYF